MKNYNLLKAVCCFIIILSYAYAQDSTKTRVPLDLSEVNKLISTKSLSGILSVKSSQLDANAIEKNLTPVPGCVEPKAPINLAELTGGWNIFFYSLTMDAAVSLGIISLGEVSANAGKEVFVYEQMYYKDAKTCAGANITYGSGVRLTILAKKLSGSANFSNLGAIAASAEIKSAEVEVRMKTIGLSGQAILALIPDAGSYSVEKHVQYMQAINDVKTAISTDSTVVVTPEIISMQLTPLTDVDFVKSVYTTFALKRIAKGDSFIVALTKLKSKDSLGEEIVKKVYLHLVKSADATKPSQIVVLTAKDLLKNTE